MLKIKYRGVAQVVAHLTGGQVAAGSSPVTPTNKNRTFVYQDKSPVFE